MKYSDWPPEIKHGDVMEWYDIAKEFLGGDTLCDALVWFIPTEDLKEILEDILSKYSEEEFNDFIENS